MRGTRPSCCAAWLLHALLLAAAPGSAEIYRCESPDGQVIYTGDPRQCPGGRVHRPTRDLQKVPSPPRAERPAPSRRPWPPPGRSAASRPTSLDPQAGSEALWRTKKSRAETELTQVAERVEALRRVVGWCNRGYGLFSEDASGIRRGHSCEEARRDFEALERAESELRAYLAGGLEEECRRAGCLPGWIRD